MTSDKLKKRIMRRVYFLFFARKAVSPTAVKLYMLMLSSVGIVSLVSVGNVVSNMPQSNVAEAVNFILYALTHTEFIVQLFVFVTLAAVLWLTRDIVRSFQHAPRLESV